jgi:hypothetical protein
VRFGTAEVHAALHPRAENRKEDAMIPRSSLATIALVAATLSTIPATHAGLPLEDDPYAPPGIGIRAQMQQLVSNDTQAKLKPAVSGQQVANSGNTTLKANSPAPSASFDEPIIMFRKDTGDAHIDY